jgi:AcrR family transcriptional regulator
MRMASSSDVSSELPSDGRVKRSERSREAIVGAVLELVGEGDPRPTAERVAERAGVGIRTVFRHYSDMESLYAAMTERLREKFMPLLGREPLSGSLAARVEDFVDTRAELFENLMPFARSSSLLRWRSEFLEADHVAGARELRTHLLAFFPELRDSDPGALEAADFITSIEAWDRLRGDQRLSRARAASVQRLALQALFKEFIA